MTDPMDDLRQASADVSGFEVLSPAAQAVLDAASNHWPGGSNHPSKRACIAAALRAAADQVVPDDETTPWGSQVILSEPAFSIRCDLLAIADELDPPNS